MGSIVTLNANNSLVAEVVPFLQSPAFSTSPLLSITSTESQFNPLLSSMAPGLVLRVFFHQQTSSQAYVFRVVVSRLSSINNITVSTSYFTFVSPVSAVIGTGDRIVASGAWSFDGLSYFLLWMDGTVSKATHLPALGTLDFTAVWSSPPSQSLAPLWPVVVHPEASAYASLINHQCAAVPMHPAVMIAPGRQIQLICLITFVRQQPTALGSYLVRIRGDGTRMPVDMVRHTTLYASSSMLYDVSFNVLYVSTYKQASFSGPKHVLRVRLNAGYNYRCVFFALVCSCIWFCDFFG